MIRLQEPQLEPYEDHSAWQASWNEDEALLAHTPPGYWVDLVMISQVKRLLQLEMAPDLRLRFLENLDGSVHGLLTLEAMQTVAPACDTAMAILDEMKGLTIDDRCRLLRRWNVIATFCNLNPSNIEAIKLLRYHARAA